jgi:nicotinate-nucleotide adenylyltransferase
MGRPSSLRSDLSLTRGQRVGLYGGSFNPPHEGHSHVAQAALRRLRLDRVIWLVTPGNPLKDADALDPLATRMSEVRGLARGPAMIVSDVERRLGSRYTVDTVRWFKARFPGVKFVWIMGADNLAGFHRWKGWRDLMLETPVAVISRPGVALKSRFSPMARRFAGARLPAERAGRLADAKPPAWVYLPAPFRFVSSTALRDLRLKTRLERAI